MSDHGELTAALRAYIDAHPDAADGLVGIAQWWLPPHLRHVSAVQLRMALGELVTRGEMRCTAMLDGTQLYARATGHER